MCSMSLRVKNRRAELSVDERYKIIYEKDDLIYSPATEEQIKSFDEDGEIDG